MDIKKYTSERSKEEKKPSTAQQFFQPKLSVNQADDVYEREADHVADKVMKIADPSAGHLPFFKSGSDIKQGESVAGASIQPKQDADNVIQGNNTLDNYAGTLNSSGQPLPDADRKFFEQRMGHNFSNVKLHTDEAAAQSAQSINALAYTTGNNIVFNTEQYSPGTDSGKKLMAHELTHVVQQSQGLPAIQRIACPDGAKAPPTVAAGTKNTIDSVAQNIIDRAADTKVPVEDRAIRAVSDIICTYYPAEAAKVRKIIFTAGDPGLHTTSVGKGAAIQGDIEVGTNFVNNISAVTMARRVLQTGHELEHIGQYRAGLTGDSHRGEREFLAFYHNAVADEFEGTRRMADATRRDLIDEALRYYNGFDKTLQGKYQTQQQELLAKRKTVDGTKGNASTAPPTDSKN
jgi:hypothetical protein